MTGPVRFTEADLRALAEAGTADAESTARLLAARFADRPAEHRVASEVVARLREAGEATLPDGTVLARWTETGGGPLAVEDLVALLAATPSTVAVELAVIELFADQPALLAAVQATLSRLRPDGPPVDVEFLAGDLWRCGGGLVRLVEADSGPIAELGPVAFDVSGLATAGRLWVDPAVLAGQPVGLLGVLVEAATERGPLAVARPGRLTLAGHPYGLGRALGRTVPGVQLLAGGLPAASGTVVEVGTGEPLETLLHEIRHVWGSTDEAECDRYGARGAEALRAGESGTR